MTPGPGSTVSEPLNAFCVDLEDWFHSFGIRSPYEDPRTWNNAPSCVVADTETLMRMLDDAGVRGTFLALGWIAERHPDLIRRLAREGHEIGCHGFAHQHIRRQTPEQFRQDIQRAKQCLTDQVQQPVVCFRAPSFSITRATLWALEILAEEGFEIDSSIFPVKHDLYGIPDATRFPHWRGQIFEFPPTTIRFVNNNFGVAGGGYLRLLPYRFTQWAIREINQVERQPAMVYFHPWEIDPKQPRISCSFRSRLRHYTNLSGMRRKIEKILKDFRFSTISDVCRELDIYREKRSLGAL